MNLILHKNKLELNHPFRISRWTYTHTQSLIVELQSDGFSGLGEATHNAYYLNTEIDYMHDRLTALKDQLSAIPILPPEDFWNIFQKELSDCPFALCALDEAYHDWYTKKKGIPLYKHWNLDINKHTPNSYTLSIDKIDVMVKRMKEHPWNIYKIKLGTERDIEMVEALRQHSKATFWVDANCAWTEDETIKKSKELSKLGVEFIEQPLPADEWDAMESVFQKSALPLIADESCKVFSDIEKCKNRFHGINIKVMKCGGLAPAKKMIKEARTHQLKVMMGCMTESTVGISAIAHLSPLIDYADMDGQHFIKNDPAEGVLVTSEKIVFPERNGTGVVFKNQQLHGCKSLIK